MTETELQKSIEEIIRRAIAGHEIGKINGLTLSQAASISAAEIMKLIKEDDEEQYRLSKKLEGSL